MRYQPNENDKQWKLRLEKNSFTEAKLRALTLALESVRTSPFYYDFSFSRSGKKEVADVVTGSFDYHAQLGIPADSSAE